MHMDILRSIRKITNSSSSLKMLIKVHWSSNQEQIMYFDFIGIHT